MQFENLIEIDKKYVLDLFQKHENHRESKLKRDVFANKIIEDLFKNNNLQFFEGIFSPQQIKRIILPYHIHGMMNIPRSGLSIEGAYEKYFKLKHDLHRENKFDECVNKITNLNQKIISGLFNNDIDNFLLFSNNAELVHPGHYENKIGSNLYIANGFHRLIARYAAYVETDLFHEFPVYFVSSK